MLLLSFFLTSCSNPLAESQKKVKLGLINWVDSISVAYLWKAILEKKGYNVQMMELDKGAMWTGVARGDVDITGYVWLPQTDKPYYDKYKDKVEVGGSWYKGAKLGLAVPEYMKDVNSIEDLNKHSSEFGGKIFGIDPGSSLMQLSQTVQKEYGLKTDLIESSEAAMLTELNKAYEQKKPVVVTLWNPHWIFSVEKLKYLEDPKGVYGKPDNIHYMMKKGFSKEHPEIVKMYEKWDMTDKELSQLIKYVNESTSGDAGYEPEKGVKKWMDENPELVKKWMNA
ncbi:glycine betaine ABC transporter substrate-binding protein [Metabacillus sp. GX 13764]|nr:glycine betaine ABC transporter substrate-binding protein [Metabacillus kandeliae]MCD7035493.1 glycine betaine ABC transporter substrate-binding protein [Metabacillus kandeliae]